MVCLAATLRARVATRPHFKPSLSLDRHWIRNANIRSALFIGFANSVHEMDPHLVCTESSLGLHRILIGSAPAPHWISSTDGQLAIRICETPIRHFYALFSRSAMISPIIGTETNAAMPGISVSQFGSAVQSRNSIQQLSPAIASDNSVSQLSLATRPSNLVN